MQLPAGFRVVRPPTPFQERVAAAVRAIPPGRVASYSMVAAAAGRPGAARAVGGALAQGLDVPAHRVVAADGRLAPGWEAEQRRRLAAEGVASTGRRLRVPIPWWQDGAADATEGLPGSLSRQRE